ncbi:MAG: thioredoxin family protein [bacterium]|nr:thioredoxin family protein [bacterium]
MIKYVTDDNFKETINNNKVALVDFFATWCGPCQMLNPVLDDISNNDKDIVIIKVNVDECPKTALEYSIMYVPSLMVFKDGKVAEKIDNATISKTLIIDTLKKYR